MDRARRAFDEWLRERPDLDGLPILVLGRLAEATQLVATAHLRPFFAAHGLGPGEFDVLATLRRAPPPHALSPTDLYHATMVTSGAMTGRIDRLETAGLIRRHPDPNDRRAVLVGLTEAGFALIDRVIGRHVANGRRVLGGLQPDEQRLLAELLGKLIAGLPPAYAGDGEVPGVMSATTGARLDKPTSRSSAARRRD